VFTEINALKAIPFHPNVIRLIDYGQSEYVTLKGRKLVNYIVMELAAGGELFNLVH